jgi:hypothetical protein
MTLTVRVGVEWINYFHAPCNQNNLDYRDDRAEGFYNSMGNHGHTKVFDWGNDNAWETDFRDPSSGGDSHNWADNVHFCFFSSHGGLSGAIKTICFAVRHTDCNGASNQWRLGSNRLKWLVLDCCHGVDNTSVGHIVSVWGAPMRGVHLVFGFIGLGHDGWWTDDLGEDFGDDAGTGSRLANAWLDRAYSYWYDDYPIAIAAGVNKADADNRRENETINWRDSGVASTGYLSWKFRD